MSIEAMPVPIPIKKKPGRKKQPALRVPVDAEKWERRLAKEGMPAELPREVVDILDEADGAASAVRAYAAERSVMGMMELTSGEHEKFARAVANKFGVSVEAARELVQDAFSHSDRFYRAM